MDDRGQSESGFGIVAHQRRFELFLELGDLIEERLLEEMQPPRHLLRDRRLLETQLAGQPQKIDLIAQARFELAALARRPARRFELDEATIDAAMNLENGDALRFGRMRGQHRLDAEMVEKALQIPGGDAGGR